MNEETYLAHLDGERGETVIEHLTEVAEMAAAFGESFGASEWAYAAGMLHDIGKYSDEFQNRLRGGSKVDHATAGAYVAIESHLMQLAYCIAGHHSGLPDGGIIGDIGSTLIGRLSKARKGLLPNFDRYKGEVSVPKVSGMPFAIDQSRMSDERYCDSLRFSIAFHIRMVFSCLVDADYLCTERFMHGVAREQGGNASLVELRDRLESHLMRFYPPSSHVNAIRCEVLDNCLAAAKQSPGVFTLTVPTGGGKTLALMRFALNHATEKGREFSRIICCEPYTSIIEQNAEVYRKVFGAKNVLEHHSNFDFDDEDGVGNSMRLASENWDKPIIVTTNVQLFESLYASRTSRCRKLHNIARSVIVLDEAQMIPTPYLKPCVKVLSELARNYGCTIVLSTATQPALSPYFEREDLLVKEIAARPEYLAEELARVHYYSIGVISDDQLAHRILEDRQVLCILNSRRQARVVFELVKGLVSDGRRVFHLTTLMHPMHRTRIIEEIRAVVGRGETLTVVATSLVEAGVDLDFETVYRAIAGIDSMVQAAGRCNREMRRSREESRVFLFESEGEYAIPTDIRRRAAVACGVEPGLREGRKEIVMDDLETIETYFRNLYTYKSDSLDKYQIIDLLSRYTVSDGVISIPFEIVSSSFRLIDTQTIDIIIQSEANSDDIEALRDGLATRAVMRRLGQRSVAVYRTDKENLYHAGAIEAVNESMYILTDDSRYREDIGLDTVSESGVAVFL